MSNLVSYATSDEEDEESSEDLGDYDQTNDRGTREQRVEMKEIADDQARATRREERAMALELQEEEERLRLADTLRERRELENLLGALRGPVIVPGPIDVTAPVEVPWRARRPPPIERYLPEGVSGASGLSGSRTSSMMRLSIGANHRLANAPTLETLQDSSLGIPVPTVDNAESTEAKNVQLPCLICMTNQIQTVNFPCMHACFCVSCAKPSVMHSNICPVCRTQYMHVSMLYLQYKEAHSDEPPKPLEPPEKRRKM